MELWPSARTGACTPGRGPAPGSPPRPSALGISGAQVYREGSGPTAVGGVTAEGTSVGSVVVARGPSPLGPFPRGPGRQVVLVTVPVSTGFEKWTETSKTYVKE